MGANNLFGFQKLFFVFCYFFLSAGLLSCAVILWRRYEIDRKPGFYSQQSNATHPFVMALKLLPMLIVAIIVFGYSMFVVHGGKNVPDFREIGIFYNYYRVKVVKDPAMSDRIYEILSSREKVKMEGGK